MENQTEPNTQATEVSQELNQPVTIDQAEWCFQFDGDSPVIFAWSKENEEAGDFNLTIPPVAGTAATFKCPNTGKTFSLLVRPMSEETRRNREQAASAENA
jgi:hypothetical protein